MSTMQTQAPTTWEDVLRMPDDGNRYEFIGGRLYMTPAPVTRHQRVLMRLWSALLRILVDSGRGEVFSAPSWSSSREPKTGSNPTFSSCPARGGRSSARNR